MSEIPYPVKLLEQEISERERMRDIAKMRIENAKNDIAEYEEQLEKLRAALAKLSGEN